MRRAGVVMFAGVLLFGCDGTGEPGMLSGSTADGPDPGQISWSDAAAASPDAQALDAIGPDAATDTPMGPLPPGPPAPRLSGTLPLCGVRFVGYGWTSAMGFDPGKRLSAPMCIVATEQNRVLAKSDVAGTCAGDSGGPLYQEGTATIIGILSGTNSTANDCGSRYTSYFVSLPDVRDFIDAALAAEPEAR